MGGARHKYPESWQQPDRKLALLKDSQEDVKLAVGCSEGQVFRSALLEVKRRSFCTHFIHLNVIVDAEHQEDLVKAPSQTYTHDLINNFKFGKCLQGLL